MKSTLWVIFALHVVSAYTAAADDAQPAPKPRIRLDPVTRTAVAAAEAEKASQNQILVMEKIVVKERAMPMERMKPPPYEGEFSLGQGGRIRNGGNDSVRWEVGVWPSIELTVTDSELRPRAEPRLRVELVKVKF
jgi:hypothetical protein